jgi:hypothetical protein
MRKSSTSTQHKTGAAKKERTPQQALPQWPVCTGVFFMKRAKKA